MSKKKRLGRGLEALLSAVPAPSSDSDQTVSVVEQEKETTDSKLPDGEIVNLNVYEIDDNPFQPRREFSETEITSLAESLKEHDILQPILVRIVNGRHQLISGERRLRAAIQANWQSIPARVREADDRLVAELAIVENLQRKDLNAIEKAMSFRRYIDEHSCTQEDLASRLKIDRSTIANLIRLLELPRPIQDAITSCEISAGHARALLPLGEEPLQIEFCQRIRAEGWSVRRTESEVADQILAEDSVDTLKFSSRSRRNRSRNLETIEGRLKMILGTKVRIKQTSKGRGSIQIEFADPEEFERIQQLLVNQGSSSRAA